MAQDGTSVAQLNEKIEEFITESVERDRELGGASDLFFREVATKCWDVLGCGQSKCPSYASSDRRCWLRSGTLCGGQVQGDLARKLASCRQCEVFGAARADEQMRLYENILILIHHLQSRAERIRDLAITDPLTGLFNRRYLSEVVRRELPRASRSRKTVGLIACDMDGLKPINDTFGHLAGDAALTACARLIRDNVRCSDLVFRIGGDEFLILLMDLDAMGPELVIERIEGEIDLHNEAQTTEPPILVGLSMGTSLCTGGDDFDQRLKEADAAMYEEKRRRKRARADR